MALPAQSATVGIIWQHVAIQEHALLAGQKQNMLTIKVQNTYTVDNHNVGKRTRGFLTPAHKVHSISLDPTDSHDIEACPWITQSLDI